MKYESHLKFLLILLYIYLACRFMPALLILLAPFILAYIVAASTRPLALLITKKWKVRPKISAAISLSINLLFLFSIIGAILARIIIEIIRLLSNSAYIIDGINGIVSNITIYLESFEHSTGITNILEELTAWLVSGFQRAANGITSFAISIPHALVFIVVFILASIFLSLDYENIRDSALRQLSPKNRTRARQLKEHTTDATFRYIRGTAILMLIDLGIAFAGLAILQVNYAFILAIFLAILDLLPIIGPSLILIPWGVISIFTGRIAFGIGLIVTYIIMTLVRELSEPKIMSKALNLHPFVTVMALYIGYQAFGVLGLIFFPIATLVLVSLQRSGVLFFWRTKEGQEL